jgi:hypothetical protein
MDALVDVDLARLRGWDPAGRLLAALPGQARASKRARLGFDWIDDVDRLVVAMRRGARPRVLVLVEGRIDPAQVAQAAQEAGERPSLYRGSTLYASGGHASAMVGGAFALGELADVRAAVDVASHVGPAALDEADLPTPPESLADAAEQPVVQLLSLTDGRPGGGSRTHADELAEARRQELRAQVGEDGLDVELASEYGSGAEAATQRDRVASGLARFAVDLEGRGLALSDDDVRVIARGEWVYARVRLDPQKCRRLSELASGMAELWLQDAADLVGRR